MGSKFSHIFLREVSLGEKLYFGAKMICCDLFLTTKELMDRRTKRQKDIKINIAGIAKAASHKLPGNSSLYVNFLSCLSKIICTTCNFLFIRNGDLIHHNWPHSGRKPLSPFSSRQCSDRNPWPSIRGSNRYQQWVVVVSRISIIAIKRESGFYPEWGRSWSYRSPLQIDEQSQVLQMMFSKSWNPVNVFRKWLPRRWSGLRRHPDNLQWNKMNY